MAYIVDAYNVMFRQKHVERADDIDIIVERENFVDFLRRFVEVTDKELVAVFDGGLAECPWPRRYFEGRLTVIYTEAAGDADDEIISIAERIEHPAAHVVVTSDREIRRRAKDAGTRLAKTEEFLPKMLEAIRRAETRSSIPDGEDHAKYTGGVSPDETRDWLDEMGFDGDETFEF